MSESWSLAGFRRGLLVSSSGSIVNLLLLFAELLIIARILPIDAYGGYVLLVALVNFLVMLTDFGFKLAVTHLISSGDRDQQPAVVSSALLFRVAVLAVGALVILLARFVVGLRYPSWEIGGYLAYLPLMLATTSLDELLSAMLQGFHAYRPMAAAQIARGCLRIALTILLLVVLHAGLAGLVYSWTLSFAAAIAYQFWALPVRRVCTWRTETLRAMLCFGRPLQFMRFLGFVGSRLHVTLLGALAGVDAVAYFSAANRIPDALQTLSDSYFRVYFPTVTMLLADGRRQAAQQLFRRSLRVVSFAGALGAVTAVVFRHEIVTVLFSAKYARSATAFGLLMIALHVSVVVNVLGYTLTAAGKPGRALWLDVGQALVLAAGDVVLIPVMGAVGAGLATVLGNYLSGPPGVWLVRRTQFGIEAAGYLRQVLLVWLCAALSWWLHPVGLFGGVATKLAILALFILLSPLLATIGRDDFSLILLGSDRRHRGGTMQGLEAPLID